MTEKIIELTSWIKESVRRGETIETYLVKEGGEQQEVVQLAINPHFLAGLLKAGVLTKHCLIREKTIT